MLLVYALTNPGPRICLFMTIIDDQRILQAT